MTAKNRIERLLQEVKVQAKAMGVDVNGYQPCVACQGEKVLAFVFYPTDDAKLNEPPVLVQLKRTDPSVEMYTPYASSDYHI